MENMWVPRCWLFFASILFPVCFATTVQFFEKPDYKGYMFETTAIPELCRNLPEYARNLLGSLKTTDCVVVSPVLNCPDESSYVIRSNVSNLATIFADNPTSYRGCSDTEKGTRLDVIISRPPPNFRHLEFKDICTCTNMPKLLRDEPLSATSEGKCVQYYEEGDCKGKPQIWGELGYLGSFSEKRIGSFKPCNLSTNCLRMDAVITKIEPINEIEDMQNFTTKLPVAATQIYCNGGGVTNRADYLAEKQIEEIFQFEFAEQFNQINSLNFDEGVRIQSMESLAGNMKSALFEIQNGLTTKYQISTNDMKAKTFGIKRTTKFSAAEEITVPPYSRVKASSFVKIANNVEVNYRVEFKISGLIKSQSERRMTAAEIRGNVKNLKFVRDLDEFTVFSETSALLKATFGQEVVVVSEGANRDSCSDTEE